MRDSALDYARTQHVGCTPRNAGAPEGRGGRWRTSGSIRTGGDGAGNGDTKATPVRVPILTGPGLGLQRPTSWQRTGKLPLRPSAKPPPNDFRKKHSEREAHASAVESRWDSLGVQQTTAASPSGSLPSDHASRFVAGVERLNSGGPARGRRGVSALHWNVGLDYTAHRANCQSANAFVEPRQTRAPRLRKAPSNTAPRLPSQPAASRASSRPCSAPSTIA